MGADTYLISLTILGSVAAILVATASLIRNPRSAIHWWLTAFIVSACAWITVGNIQSLLPENLALLAIKLTFVAASVLGFTMLYFVKEVTGIKKRRWLTIDIAVLSTAIVLNMSNVVVPNIIGINSVSLQPERGWGYPIVLLLILQFILRGISIVIRAVFKNHGRKRAQLKVIAIGLICGTGFAVISNIILPNITGNTFTSRFAFLAVLIWTALLMYAVVQYRFLDIRLAIVRSLGYIAALLSVVLLYTLFVTFVWTSLLPITHRVSYSLQMYDILIVALAATTFHPLRLFFDRITKRIFYRDAYDSQKVFNEISSSLVHLTDSIELSKATLDSLTGAIRPVFAAVIILSDTNAHKPRIIRVGKSPRKELKVVELLEETALPLVFEDDLTASKSILRGMDQAEIALGARLGTQQGTVGYMLLGRKGNGATFTKQDVELARIVGDGLAVAIQNALRFEEIRNFTATLQDKVSEATKELRTTNSQLQRLDEAKDEFISMASHQLRTPLTSVKGYISMVLEEDAGKITPTQHQLLSEAFASSERMVHLINDFLNVSRLQTGKFMLEKRPIDLSKLVGQEVESLQTTAQMHALKIRYKKPPYFPLLAIDEAKIRQVIMNFIDNAIYYSPEGTTIGVELTIEDGQAVVKVRDTGIGVPKAEQPHLFSKFFRATNARKQRPDGTGVGLFLAKKVINAHGGVMAFESTEGKGSVFGFRLPIKKLSPKKTDSTE